MESRYDCNTGIMSWTFDFNNKNPKQRRNKQEFSAARRNKAPNNSQQSVYRPRGNHPQNNSNEGGNQPNQINRGRTYRPNNRPNRSKQTQPEKRRSPFNRENAARSDLTNAESPAGSNQIRKKLRQQMRNKIRRIKKKLEKTNMKRKVPVDVGLPDVEPQANELLIKIDAYDSDVEILE